MTGKLKVLSLSQEIEGLKAKKSYIDAVIHFRDYNNHTLTLKNKKEYILSIQALSVEAESLLFEGDIWIETEDDDKPHPIITELRFWPFWK
jgi:hypothetical protein